MVDTAVRYHESVYGSAGGFVPDQLSAMPSVHVGWALLVAICVITMTRGWWRWLALAHPLLTVVVVTVTANHYWSDGIMAALLLGKSKDNNGSTAIGPFIRLFDATFSLDDVRACEVRLEVEGADGFASKAVATWRRSAATRPTSSPK